MRTTIVLDDALLAAAMRISGAKTKRATVEAGLRALLRQEARRGAIALKGTMPDLEAPRRRRTDEQP